MNKETTSYIWGLLLILFCGIGFIFHLMEVFMGKTRDWYDWSLMAITLYGFISGYKSIFNNKKKI